MRAARHSILALLILVLSARTAPTIDEIAIEESIADLLPQEQRGDVEDTAQTRQWAILPQLGYAPDKGPLGGVKFTHRNLLGTGLSFDIAGTYALKKQQLLAMSLEQPHLAGGRFLAAVRFRYTFDPQRDFFGLGNNDQGPDPASTNSFQDVSGAVTVGWRPMPGLAINFTAGLRHVNISDGDQLAACGAEIPCPFTQEAFPDMPGVYGGWVNPLSLSLVWNDRDDFIRPTRGWRAILKITHTNRHMISDFQYTSFINSADAQQEFKLDARIFERIVNDFRYSYGTGLRFALGEALVARVDVGFSDEETGLVYLSFGQTF